MSGVLLLVGYSYCLRGNTGGCGGGPYQPKTPNRPVHHAYNGGSSEKWGRVVHLPLRNVSRKSLAMLFFYQAIRTACVILLETAG